MNTVRISELLMRKFERFPQFSENEVGRLNEIFNHQSFLNADNSKRQSVMLASSKSKYEDEFQYPFDNYFGFSLRPFLESKSVLDLGCFTGGRSVAWFQRYALRRIAGVDIKEVYIEAARQFGYLQNVNHDFRVGFGESLPFEDETFDAILSFDVFEHVANIQRTLSECRRVLKGGGRLFCVFPSYFHPTEHHLRLVTRIPCIHWFFSGKTLTTAYCKILERRGDDAYWYKRSSPCLESWEKCNSVNGTTFSQFKKLVHVTKWQVFKEVHKALGSVGRMNPRCAIARLIGKCLAPLTYLPYLQEVALHRIIFVLVKGT